MTQPRIIKRYANRKMYDTSRSCYVTLEEVAEMVRGGLEVQVIDNKTKSDLTEVTLTQALLDSERKRRGTVPLAGLRTLIAQGNDFLQKKVAQPVTRVRDEAHRSVESWREEAERAVQTWRHEAERVLHARSKPGAIEEATAGEAEAGSEAEEARARSRRWPLAGAFSPDDLQHILDELVHRAVATWAAPPSHSLEDLAAEVVELRREVQELRERLAAVEIARPGPSAGEAGTQPAAEVSAAPTP